MPAALASSVPRLIGRAKASVSIVVVGLCIVRGLLLGAVLAFCGIDVARAGTAHDPIDPIPWEAGERADTGEGCDLRSHGFAARIELAAIRFYAKRISPASIPRCLFAESCSQYASRAIRTKGSLLGVLYFIDRYFYRENARSQNRYLRGRLGDGRWRLDDGFFLSSKTAALQSGVTPMEVRGCGVE